MTEKWFVIRSLPSDRAVSVAIVSGADIMRSASLIIAGDAHQQELLAEVLHPDNTVTSIIQRCAGVLSSSGRMCRIYPFTRQGARAFVDAAAVYSRAGEASVLASMARAG